MLNRPKNFLKRLFKTDLKDILQKMYPVFLVILVYSVLFLIIRSYQLILWNDIDRKTITIGILGTFENSNFFLAKELPEKIASNLIYCGLMRFDPKNLAYKNLLAQEVNFSSDLKTINVKLKPQVFWKPNKFFSSSEYENFYSLIKTNQEVKHPIKINFQGIDFKKINEQEFQLNLSSPYSPFFYNLTIPLIESLDTKQSNFCGPYLLNKIVKTQFGQELVFRKNLNYNLTKPAYDRIIIKTYQKENDLIKDFNQGKISLIINNEYSKNFKFLKHSRVLPVKNGTIYLTIFNLENAKFKDKTTRQYLAQLINKRSILNQVLSGYGNIIEAPLNYKFYKIQDSKIQKQDISNSNIVKAPQDIKLSYPQTQIFNQIAHIIKSHLEQAGIKVNLDPLDIKGNFIETLKNKDYELMLIGQNYIYPPDPYSFWSSSQIKFPGQNIANLINTDIDQILDKIRTTIEVEAVRDLAIKFNSLIKNELPAIFIFSPDYIAITNKKVFFPNNLHANYSEEIINSIL